MEAEITKRIKEKERIMRKIRKVMALLLTLAMVLGLSVTAFAANTATIKIYNLDEFAQIQYVQVIKADPSTETGWSFTNEGANAYRETFGGTSDGAKDQTIIWNLLKYSNPDLTLPEGVETIEVSASKISTALSRVTEYPSNTIIAKGTIASFEVSEAGVYAIKATTREEAEELYAYDPMAAYVGFKYNNGTVEGFQDQTINAKKADLIIDKTYDDEDGLVYIGKELTYAINTVVPNISNVEKDKVKYTIKDTIRGAEYVTENVSGKEMVTLHITVGVNAPITRQVEVSKNANNQTFTVDLSDIAKNPEYINQTLKIEYKAVVTEIVGKNTVEVDDGQHDFDKGESFFETYDAILLKKDEQGNLLNNAEFVLYDATNKKYAICADIPAQTDSINKYFHDGWVVTGWTDDIEQATKMKTENGIYQYDTAPDGTASKMDGVIRVSGLEYGTKYQFVETNAPEGYSKNENPAEVDWNYIWEPDNNIETKAIIAVPHGKAEMTDTKLAELPGTGGIGTTIFTIGGCVIMIAAAGLYFASRRKHGEN